MIKPTEDYAGSNVPHTRRSGDKTKKGRNAFIVFAFCLTCFFIVKIFGGA